MRSIAIVAISLIAATLARADNEREQSRAHFVKGTHYYQAGDYKSAIAEYELAYKILPIPEILFNLGQAHRLRGDTQQAIDLYERYLAIAPNGRVADEARSDVTELKAQKAAAEKAAAEKAAAEKAAAEKAAAEKAAAKAAAEKAAADRAAAQKAAAQKAAADKAAADKAAAQRAATERATAAHAAESSAAAPALVAAAPAPAKPPLYRRWWVWTAAGGAAAVLAIGLGVGLTHAPGAPAANTSDGTLRPF